MNKQMWYEQTRQQISHADIWGCSGRLLAEASFSYRFWCRSTSTALHFHNNVSFWSVNTAVWQADGYGRYLLIPTNRPSLILADWLSSYIVIRSSRFSSSNGFHDNGDVIEVRITASCVAVASADSASVSIMHHSATIKLSTWPRFCAFIQLPRADHLSHQMQWHLISFR